MTAYQEQMSDALANARAEIDILTHTVNGGTARLAVDDGMRIITASEGYYRMTGYTKDSCQNPPFLGRGINLVLPQDLDNVNFALQELSRNHPARVSFRIRKKDGSIAWNTAYCAQIDTSGPERSVDVFFIDITESRKTQVELEKLLDNIPAGVVRITVKEELSLEYANHEFYRQSGYLPEEFASVLHGNCLGLVYPDDRAALLERARDYAASDRESNSVNYRIITKAGETRWMRAIASRLSEPDEPSRVLQCVITDITEEHEHIKNLELSEERYRIITEQTRETIFEWDIVNDKVQFSPVYEKMFGFMPPPDVSVENLTSYKIVYEDDRAQVRKMINQIIKGAPHAESEYRAKCADGSYIWCRNRVTTIFDEEGRPIRAVGLLSDINDYMKKTFRLEEKALHDSLTGLLNRMAFQHQIEHILCNTPQGRYAFLLLDIDKFKQINDSLGHTAGDVVLQQTARLLTESFRATDLFARMGGDEFAIFLLNINSANSVLDKAKLLSHKDMGLKLGSRVTLSIGIALYPDDGRNFQTLYKCADEALYDVKRKGGGDCHH